MFTLISLFLNSAMASVIALSPMQTYTPMGFDTNDSNVQIGFDSMYPDSCYHYLPSKAQVLEEEKLVRIDNLSNHREDQLCMKVIRYYDEVVDLGPVTQEGLYDVQFLMPNGEYKTYTQIRINRPEDSGSVDNALYAPVTDARLVKNGEEAIARLKIKSAYPCLEFKDVRIDITRNTIELLPVMEQPSCQESDVNHTYEKDVNLGKIKGKFLLHIRAMNSKAINKFIEI